MIRPFPEVADRPLAQVLAHMVDDVRDRSTTGQQAYAALDESEVRDAHDQVLPGSGRSLADHRFGIGHVLDHLEQGDDVVAHRHLGLGF